MSRHANSLFSHVEDREHSFLGVIIVEANKPESFELGARSINLLDVNESMLLHALILNLLDHVRGHKLVNVNVYEEVLRILSVLINLILELPNLLLGSISDVISLDVITFAFLIVLIITLINCKDTHALNSQALILVAIGHLFHATTQLSQLSSTLNRAVLLIPSRRIFARAPNMVFEAILDFSLVTNNDVLVAEVVLDSSAALLVVHLDLEVLVTVKIEQIVDLVGPLSIVGIILIDLVGPPRYHLSFFLAALQPKRVKTWLITSSTFGQRNLSLVPSLSPSLLALAWPGI